MQGVLPKQSTYEIHFKQSIMACTFSSFDHWLAGSCRRPHSYPRQQVTHAAGDGSPLAMEWWWISSLLPKDITAVPARRILGS